MSQLKPLPPPRRWSKAGKDWIAKLGVLKSSEAIGVKSCTLSSWHHGKSRVPTKRVEQIITLALGQGVCLTPADLGRPDLAKKGGEG